MNIVCNTHIRNLNVKIKGDIDHHSTEEIREKVDKAFDRSSAKNIIFDFSDVTFMDSSGIGMIMGRYKNVSAKGGKVVVAGVNTEISRILEISGLHKIIMCVKSGEESAKI